MFLKMSQNPQENSLSKVSARNLNKKRLWHRCFRMNFAKFLRAPFYRTTPMASSDFKHVFYSVYSLGTSRKWPKYGFSLTRVFLCQDRIWYSVLIRILENPYSGIYFAVEESKFCWNQLRSMRDSRNIETLAEKS